MNDVLLTTVEDIKEVTSISRNIDTALLEPYLVIAEEFYILDILGQSLTTEIKDQITGNTLTFLNDKLIRVYIRPLVAYACWYEAMPFINYKTVQKGIVKQTSDNTESVSLDEFDLIRNAVQDKIRFFQTRLKTYLDDNAASYPLYRANCNNTTAPYNNGIYLGGSLNDNNTPTF
jgi:hypothetical protein